MKVLATEDGAPITTEAGAPIALEFGFSTGLDALDLLAGRQGQFGWSIRYEYLDFERNLLDELETVAPGTVGWSASGGRSARSLTGLRLPPAHPLVANAHRVRVVWIIAGQEFPVGTFEYLDGDLVSGPGGDWTETAAMPDSSGALAWPLSDAVALAPGDPLVDAFAALAAVGEIPPELLDLDASELAVGADGLVFAGAGSSVIGALGQVSTLLAWLPPHFTNDDRLRGRRVPSPEDDEPDFVLTTAGEEATILADTLKRSSPAQRPNLYIASTTSPTGIPFTQRISLPKVGGIRPAYVDVDGASSSEQVYEALRAAARADRSTTRTVTFEIPPNPLFDAYPIVELDGERFLGQSWDLPGDGSPMTVVVSRSYIDDA